MWSTPILQRTLVSGTTSGLAALLAASLAGKRESASYTAPLNATSHSLWGEKAARQNRASLKYTVTGVLLNHAAAVLWAAVYEKWMRPAAERWLGRRRQTLAAPLLGAAAVTGAAYVTDYYLVQRRFTPGFEKRVSGRSMVTIYAALALGLACGTWLLDRERP